MAQSTFEYIPRRSFYYMLICVGVVLAYLFIMILPAQNHLNGMEIEVKNLRSQLEVQKKLLPLYQVLMARVEAEKKMALPFPEERGVSRRKMGEVQATFSDLAGKNNLRVEYILPDFQTMPKGPGVMSVDVSLIGNFANFRGFMGSIGALPALKHIEELEISAAGGEKTFRMKFWVVIGK